MNDTTTPTPSSDETTPAPVGTRSRGRRIGLIAGIAAAGLGVVALTSGVTLAVADEWNDDDDDRTQLVADRDDDADGQDGSGQDAQSGSGQGSSDDATASPDDFVDALALALDAADGTGAESIEAETWGWSVDVVRGDGTEVEVRLDLDGTATLGDEDRADGTRQIDEAALRSAIEASLDERQGDVHSVGTTDDAGAAYEVTVIQDGVERDLLVDASFAVIGTDT